MGAVKKAYQDWCEKQDIEPDSNEAQSIQQASDDLAHITWRKEFEDWLDGIAKKYSRDEGDEQ